MKKTILAVSLSLLAASAFATGTEVLQSQVSGGVAGSSSINGVNQLSVHGSLATSKNVTTIQGQAASGEFRGVGAAGAETVSTTQGSTFTAAGGFGLGGSEAAANQAGYGLITVGAGVGNKTAEATSSTFTATGSKAVNVNSGLSVSGTTGQAANASVSAAAWTPRVLFFPATYTTTGTSVGEAVTTSFGFHIGGNESETVYGTSSYMGQYKGGTLVTGNQSAQ